MEAAGPGRQWSSRRLRTESRGPGLTTPPGPGRQCPLPAFPRLLPPPREAVCGPFAFVRQAPPCWSSAPFLLSRSYMHHPFSKLAAGCSHWVPLYLPSLGGLITNTVLPLPHVNSVVREEWVALGAVDSDTPLLPPFLTHETLSRHVALPVLVLSVKRGDWEGCEQSRGHPPPGHPQRVSQHPTPSP